MEEMIKIQLALLEYIKSRSPYEISRFLQYQKELVSDALYYTENTPVSVKEDLENDKKKAKLLSEIKELLNSYQIE